MTDAGSLAMPRRSVPLVVRETAPPVSNARIAMLVVIAAESMLFAGLIGMYLVFRLSRPWPPADLPRLPIGLTTVNTLILFASALPMSRALGALRRGDRRLVARALALTALLGTLFLAVQGVEWVRLLRHGLTLGGSMYGATFYVLIGCHGVHVLAAVTWLAVTAVLAARGAFRTGRHAALEMCAMYWYFVCALWVVLFPLVYLY
jgi:heme/copper-type cytochrome/quinol oxidase subunit 3